MKAMKTINILLSILLMVSVASAQEKKIEYLHSGDHMGLFRMGSFAGELIRSEPAPDNKMVYILKALDANLEVVASSHAMIQMSSRFINMVSNDDRAVLVFENSGNEFIEFVKTGPDGRIVSHQIYTDNPNDDYVWNNLSNVTIDEMGLVYLARYYQKYEDDKRRKVEEAGVELLCFGEEFDLKWTKKIKAPGDRVSLNTDKLVAFNGGCVAMISENSRLDKNFTTALHFVNPQGNVLGKYELKKGEDIYYPTSFLAQGDKLVACGMYFDEPWYKALNSAGMFFARFDASGKEVTMQTQGWKAIDETVNSGNSSDFFFSGKMKVLVHDIYANANGYNVICESYQKATGVTGAEILLDSDNGSNKRSFTIFDFIIFDFDANGKLLKSRKIEKEKRNIEVLGNIAYKKGVELSFILRDNYLFSYRYVHDDQLVYMNLEDNEPMLYWADLNSGDVLKHEPIAIQPVIIEEEDPAAREMIDNSKVLSGLEKFANKVDQVDQKMQDVGEDLERGITKNDQVFTIGSPRFGGLVYLGNGVSVSYILFPPQNELYLKKM